MNLSDKHSHCPLSTFGNFLSNCKVTISKSKSFILLVISLTASSPARKRNVSQRKIRTLFIVFIKIHKYVILSTIQQNARKINEKNTFVITKSVWGGAQKYVYDLAVNLPKDRFETIVAGGGQGIMAEK